MCLFMQPHSMSSHNLSSNISSFSAPSRQEGKERQGLISIRDWPPLVLSEKKKQKSQYLFKENKMPSSVLFWNCTWKLLNKNFKKY